MSRLLDHVKQAPITDRELDKVRAQFITGRLRMHSYSYMNLVVAGLLARLEITEGNVDLLQKTLADVQKQLDAARKEL